MNIFHPFTSVAFFLLLGSVLPHAADAAEKRGKTNRELIEAEGDTLESAEKKMEAAYGQLLGILNDTGKATLKESQEKWLAWREAQAEFDSHHLEGGKLRPLEARGSQTQMTKMRTTQLLDAYKRFKDLFSNH